VAASVDGAYENGGEGEWHTSVSNVYGCDGRGCVDGWIMGASTQDAWNKKANRGGRQWTPTDYKSDGRILGLESSNSKVVRRCLGRGLVLKLEKISTMCIHINNNELLIQNSKIQYNINTTNLKFKQYLTLHMILVMQVTCPFLDGHSSTFLGPTICRNPRTLKMKGFHKIKKSLW
jgi:hypothetical protein